MCKKSSFNKSNFIIIQIYVTNWITSNFYLKIIIISCKNFAIYKGPVLATIFSFPKIFSRNNNSFLNKVTETNYVGVIVNGFFDYSKHIPKVQQKIIIFIFYFVSSIDFYLTEIILFANLFPCKMRNQAKNF